MPQSRSNESEELTQREGIGGLGRIKYEFLKTAIAPWMFAGSERERLFELTL